MGLRAPPGLRRYLRLLGGGSSGSTLCQKASETSQEAGRAFAKGVLRGTQQCVDWKTV
jgi:hypothetical protein